MYDINPSAGGPDLSRQALVLRLGPLADEPVLHPGIGRQRQRWQPEPSGSGMPDPSVRGKFNTTQNSGSIRLTYQATPRNKFFVLSRAAVAALDRRARGDVAGVVHRLPVPHQPVHDCRMDLPADQQARWPTSSGPITVKASAIASRTSAVRHADRCARAGRGSSCSPSTIAAGAWRQPGVSPRDTTRRRTSSRSMASLSYVTGAHNMKFGFQNEWGRPIIYSQRPSPPSVDYYFVNRVPDRVRQWATPIHTATSCRPRWGSTRRTRGRSSGPRSTPGLRFDYLRQLASPSSVWARGSSCRTRNVMFAATDFYGLKDLTPRLGFSYDLFGDGKTALKAHWGKYVEWTHAPALATRLATCRLEATRTWTRRQPAISRSTAICQRRRRRTTASGRRLLRRQSELAASA